MSYKYILFDLDGTLTDSGSGIANCVRYALEKMKIDPGTESIADRFVGPPLSESYAKYYNMNPEQIEEAIKLYRERYSVTGLFENEVYKGVPEMLQILHENGRKLILATSKPEIFAGRILEHFQLIKYFDFISGSTLDGSRSDKSSVIKHVLTTYNITDMSEVIMVGDRNYDVTGAAKYMIDCIGVLYGYGSEEELRTAGAKYIARNCSEVAEIIKLN